ncbi:cAMP-responsive element-binding protein-like 2 isoform X4 [Dinothrombium tinctorium]|uniref:cAMP-responsive element-binding protein-like 2 isoform X4 n=1 Tax=Dinothrombium tinctorium TaxID=1965070 RepID=A0A443RQ23_9ACAR|nr:cAMP-responsive element-binding protein-like 2 isoform X4 [Dinothrombium tinctorium]
MQTESVNIKRELEDDDREFNSVYNQNKEGKTANSECSPNNGYYQSSGQRQQLASSSSNHFVSLRKGRKIRKSSKIDMKAKLERSRQSARECRARKKLRYQYLEDLVAKREKAVLMLHKEIEMVS